MTFADLPIKRKVTAVIMLTSLIALLLTAATFILYDFVTYRQMLVQDLSAMAARLARNSAPALAARNETEARQLLVGLRANPGMTAAALYDPQHNLFARYPAQASVGRFPLTPGTAGHRFSNGQLQVFEPVRQAEGALGTLFLQSDLRPLYQRLRFYGEIVLLVLCGSVLVALGFSNLLQRQISEPILALAHTAKVVSERADYTVRAPKLSQDELGQLTEAFNQMLGRIQEAEAARSFLAAIVESSNEAIIGKDLESRVVSWNVGAERMFGYSAPEMLGQSIRRLVAPEHPEEEDRILHEVKQGQTRHSETVRLRKDGTPLQVSLTVSPIRNGRGEIIGVSSIARDITERKRAQQALEHQAATLREQAELLELANVLARDLEDHIILWNRGMEQLYGWSREEAVGQVAHALLHTEFPEPLAVIRQRLFQQGHWEGELCHTRKDGRQLIVASQWFLQQPLPGRPAAILEVNNDISARKEAEQQIRQLNLKLEERVEARTHELTAANKELEAFTYSVAHDLRAPLRHIDAFGKILYEEFATNLPPEARRYLETIRNGSHHMSQLVDDLLNLARVGRQELKRHPTPLGKLAEEVRADLQPETKGRDIEWRLHDLPTIQCDPGLMKQVFANLLSNAVKYTRPRPHAIIEVGTLPSNGSLTIFVRDNGVGFNMKYINKLFGVFQRLHRADEFEGTGVGLATVERIIRKHGGCVWAEAALDKGAAFYFSLPATRQDKSEIPNPKSETTPKAEMPTRET